MARSKSSQGGWILGISAVALFIIGAFIAVSFIRSSMHPLETLQEPFPDESGRPPERYQDLIQPPLNILVIASASPAETGGRLEEHLETRAEALFVVHLSKGHHASQVVTLPTDTVVTTDRFGAMPLHEVMGANDDGCVGDLVYVVESLLEDRMNHVIMLDLEATVEITDSLGGIPLTDGYAGPDEVESYLAASTGGQPGAPMDPEAQQQLIRALLTRLDEPEVLESSGVVRGIRSSLERNTAADEQLHSGQLLNIGRSIGAFSPRAITFCMLPTEVTAEGVRVVDTGERLATLRDQFYNDSLSQCEQEG